MSRYNKRVKATNRNDLYENTFTKRGVVEVVQYSTPTLRDLTEEDKLRIPYVEYTWRAGDRYWNLASRFFGDPRQWWVIAEFNNKPTEGHIKKGDIIRIPVPLENFLRDI